MSKLDLQTLESWLWDSANILRGSIDSADFKNYIFGLLFLKRANDVFEEEVTDIMERDHITREEALDEPYFKVPLEARWDEIKKVTENIGIALDIAFAAIEAENNSDTNSLEGVLTSTKFGDKEKLSDEVLQRLLRHFNQYSLKNRDLYTPDLLGDAYEYLIKQFADDAGKKGGEFYSPRGVVQTIVQLIKPQPKQKVYDPTCGSGGMLIESAKYVAALPDGLVGNNVNISLYGQEKNLSTWAIGKMNMLLHNYDSADLRKGDTLNDPKHKNEEDELMVFDRVIANPPFSQDGWWSPAEANQEVKLDKDGKEKKVTPNYKKEVTDKFGRFHFGIPPRGYADLAFLQHMIAVLKQDGKAGVVLPHGTLFRSGSEGEIREKLLKADLIEAIVGLPAALFYNTGIPASIWIINKQKPESLKNKVVVIDASNEYKEGKNQNELLDTHIQKIVDTYNHFVDLRSEPIPNEKFARLVALTEIAGNDYNLNISRYIDTSEPEVAVDLQKVQQSIIELETREKEIDAQLSTFFTGIGIMRTGYKMTELGEIPESWEVIYIKDIGEIVSGGTPETKNNNYWNGEIRWCTPTDITSLKGKKYISETFRKISVKGLENSSATIIPPNSIVVCTRATIGYCAINTIEITTNQGFKSIVPSINRDTNFIYYLINNIRDTIISLSSGSTFLEISKKAFESIKIPLPPLPEQQKIASILSTVDEKIEVIEEQITQTRELKKGLMQKLLTRGIGHTQFKDSVLGEIPESWEVGYVGEAFNICNNLRFPINRDLRKTIPGQYPYYGPTKIQDYINEYRVNGKYALIGEDGDHFLKWNEWPMTLLIQGKFNVNNHAHLVQGGKNTITEWFFYYFNQRELTTFLTRQGAGRYKLTKNALSKIPIPLPSLQEQQKIAIILTSVDDKLEVLQSKKQEYQELKKGIDAAVVNGEGTGGGVECKNIFKTSVILNITSFTNQKLWYLDEYPYM